MQVANEAPHSRAHVPAAHTRPAAQALPQAPQLARSVSAETQRPPQTTWPVGHWVWQVPITQASARPQARPQEPQLAGSSCRLTQLPPQVVRGDVQAGAMSVATAASPPTTDELLPQPRAATVSSAHRHLPRR